MAIAEVVPIRAEQRTTLTLFANRYGLSCERVALTLKELADLIRGTHAPAKENLPLLKMGVFGDVKTSEGSFRSDANLLQITGVEGDYDKGQVDPQEAVALLKDAGVQAIVHASPRYRWQHPKWRVLCPTSRPLDKGERARLAARLNGVLGGVLDKASFTASQCYYFGSCETTDEMFVEVVEGRPIDTLEALDAGAVWPEGPKPAHGNAAPVSVTQKSSLGLDLYERRKVTREQLERILADMPNGPGDETPWKDHDTWKDVGFCISSMTDHAPWAGEMFIAWSNQWGGEKPDRPQQLWNSIVPGTERYGWTHLAALHGRHHGDAERIWRVSGVSVWPERPFDGEAPEEKAPAAFRLVSTWSGDPALIPARDWLVSRLLLRRHVSILAAPGATAKSTFTLQVAVAMAMGMEWGGFRPTARYKTLILNVEDDTEEMRRRMAAAARTMNVDLKDVDDWVCSVDALEDICVASTIKGERKVKDLFGGIVAAVRENAIDCVIVDPFTETFEGDESSNSEAKWAAALWRRLARECQCAVWLVHHTPKANKDMQGDVAAVRGAGAIANVTRIAATMFTMSEEEAEAAGIEPEARDRYVRYDDAKANLMLKGQPHWFEKVGVAIGNGDEIGSLKPWRVPGMFDNLSMDEIVSCLRVLNATPDQRFPDLRYSFTSQSGDYAGNVVERYLKVTPDRAKAILDTWLKSGRIFKVEYKDRQRKRRDNGIGVNWEGISNA